MNASDKGGPIRERSARQRMGGRLSVQRHEAFSSVKESLEPPPSPYPLVPLIFDFFKKSLVIWGHRGLERCAVRTASPSRGSRRLFSST